ncbi:MAG TPA: glycosyltransferase family 39 protein [Bacteroidales bacterium]|nr:glycosyltransferase family 39 protein [Bacteroidales bacterium]
MLKEQFQKVNSFYLRLIDKNFISKKESNLILYGIIAIVLLIRIYTFNVPLTDRTSWKEIDYITISQNYLHNGFNLFRPTITWPAEEPRVTAMEFPLVPYLAAILYRIFGFNTFSVRIIPLIVYLMIILVVFKLVNKEIGPVPALFAAAMAGFIPLTSDFGNILFSYPVAVLTGVTSIYLFYQWTDNNNKKGFLIISGFLFSITLLLMPTELTIIIPLLWLFFRKYGTDIKRWKTMFFFIIVSFILPVLWYTYAYYLTRDSIDVFGVFGGHDKYQTFGMLSKEWWYLRILKRIYILLSGPLGFFSCFVGVCSVLFFKKGTLFLFYGISFAAFVIIVAEGNIDAPYRQFCGIPALSAFFGIGFTYIISLFSLINIKLNKDSFRPFSLVIIGMTIIVLVFLISNYRLLFNSDKEQPMMPNEWILGKEIQKNSATGSFVITAGTYTIHKGGNDLSPVLFYYSNRQGWIIQKNQLTMDYINAYKQKGATLFAAENISREPELKSFCEEIKKNYHTIYQDDALGLLLVDLTSQNKILSQNRN